MNKLHKDNNGLAHVVLIVVALVVIAAIGFVGWRVLGKGKSKTVDTVASIAAQAECKKEIDDNDFCKFASSWSGLGAYTTTMNSTSAQGSSTIVMESDGGERSHFSTSSDGKVVAESITIGATTYTKDLTDNQWTKYTSPDYKPESIKDELDINFTEAGTPEAEKTTYKKIGKEACDKLTCFKYQVVDPSNPSDETFIWFDDQDYLMRRWQFKNTDGTTDSTFSYGQVSISEPSPIKEASAGAPTPEEIQKMVDAYSSQAQ